MQALKRSRRTVRTVRQVQPERQPKERPGLRPVPVQPVKEVPQG